MGAALLPAIAEAVSPRSGAASVSGDRAAMLAGAIAAGLAIVVAMRLGAAPSARPARTARTTRTDAEGDERPTGPVELCPASSSS